VLYAGSAAAPGPLWLLAARLPGGLQHAMQAAQGAMAATLPPARRAAAFGRLAAAYGAGFALGSLLGGEVAAHGGPRAALLAAALLAALAAAAPLLLAPAAAAPAAAAPAAPSHSLLAALRTAAARPALATALLLLGGVAVATGVFRAGFSLAAAAHFGLAPSETGRVLAAVGALGLAVNTLVVGPLTAAVPARRLVPAAVAVLALGLAALAVVPSAAWLLVALAPIAAGGSLLRTTLVALVTALVPGGDAGTALALSHAGGSLAGLVAPALAGALLAHGGGFPAVGPAAAALLLLAAAVFEARRRRDPDLAAALAAQQPAAPAALPPKKTE
jgi:predicted MFS family arabinose efflux permease